MVEHNWKLTHAQARALQSELAVQVIVRDTEATPPALIAGVDVGFEARNTITRAAVVVLRFPGLEVIEQQLVKVPTQMPYIPGLLSFRELPALLPALEKLKNKPDLIMCDGHGIAHPRGLGIASHLGVLLNKPTIGVAKKKLVGEFEMPSDVKGSATPLHYHNQLIGTVLRTRERVKPVFVSPGHRISHAAAVALTLQCVTRYRLPEPTRLADKLSKAGVESLQTLLK
ncbi:MAG TPA: deoxyribonuclease V [Gammaproteobacteria bacterium]|nr:deoxyribonuclease V [Gammaproteobacteria bacterium]